MAAETMGTGDAPVVELLENSCGSEACTDCEIELDRRGGITS